MSRAPGGWLAPREGRRRVSVQDSSAAQLEEGVSHHLLERGPSSTTFVFLHGYSSGADHMRSCFQDWRDAMPGASFLFLQSARRCSAGFAGHAWLPLTSDAATLAAHLQRLAPKVAESIRQLVDQEGLGRDLVLVGHSQGAMLGLEILTRALLPLWRLVSISGLIPLPERLGAADGGAAAPEVFIVHGAKDRMIALEKAEEAERSLSACGLRVSLRVLPTFEHAVSRPMMEQVLLGLPELRAPGPLDVRRCG